MKNENLLIVFFVVLIVGALFFITVQFNKSNSGQSEKPAATPTPTVKTLPKPSMIIDPKKHYQATLHTTAGDIVFGLKTDMTPITCNNFVYLAKNHFYDNTIFHRVVKDFMIQGGDPKGDGTGGPGYEFDNENFTGDYNRGIVAMANAGRNTNGSQFFIVQKDVNMPKDYVIFGEVTQGINIVDQIADAPVTMSAQGEMSKPVNPVKILSVTITEQ